MIVTYEDVQRGLQNRTSVKTLDHIFLKSIERGANCPPFISNAILEAAKRVYNLGNSRGEDEAIKPGQLKIIGTLSSEPAGKPLKQCSTGVCLVTFNAGREDQEILFRDGVTALRRARVLRICEEAHEQGVDLTQEDLAFNIFGCGLRTIRRDIKALRDEGIYVPTRGQQKDIGPGSSHKVLAVQMYLDRKTELEIARKIYHSLKAIERYTVTFARVISLIENGFQLPEIAFVVQISEGLVKQYQQLYERYNRAEYRDRIEELVRKVQQPEVGGKKKSSEEAGEDMNR
jgi:hypothetical protein